MLRIATATAVNFLAGGVLLQPAHVTTVAGLRPLAPFPPHTLPACPSPSQQQRYMRDTAPEECGVHVCLGQVCFLAVCVLLQPAHVMMASFSRPCCYSLLM